MVTSFSNRMLIVCLLAFVLCLVDVNVSAQDTEVPDKGGQIKFDVLLFTYGCLQNYPTLRLSMQYEQQIPWNRKTFNFGFYYFRTPITGGPAQYDYYFRPQLRHYFSKEPYHGFFVGIFPVAHFRDAGAVHGEYFGGGLITGCQFAISKRLRFENTIWYAGTWGSEKYPQGMGYPPSEVTQYKPMASFEVSVGWMLRKQK